MLHTFSTFIVPVEQGWKRKEEDASRRSRRKGRDGKNREEVSFQIGVLASCSHYTSKKRDQTSDGREAGGRSSRGRGESHLGGIRRSEERVELTTLLARLR